MNNIGASFLITGEVVGERPMSQNKSSMNAVLKLSGLQGLIVRPLSARLLPITIPEEQKWIDREKLLDISGRNRSRQMALAEQFGIVDYPTPAGGCLLTEPNFAHRLKIYLDKNPDALLDSLRVLRYGRQFYIDDHILLIVGRNQMDNERLIELSQPSDLLLKVLDYPGPVGLLRASGRNLENDFLNFAAGIVARYSDGKDEDVVNIALSQGESDSSLETLTITPLLPEQVTPVV
jgi:tRNA-uridine 2-sulfurtransferase